MNATAGHLFRVIEFSSAGIEKFGSAEILTRTNRKQLSPRSDDGRRPALMIYIPPDVTALKIFVKGGIGKKLILYSQKFERNGDDWAKTGQLSRFQLLTDLTNYIEIVKAIFPKGSGDE